MFTISKMIDQHEAFADKSELPAYMRKPAWVPAVHKDNLLTDCGHFFSNDLVRRKISQISINLPHLHFPEASCLLPISFSKVDFRFLSRA
jgi:hypothetical protein